MESQRDYYSVADSRSLETAACAEEPGFPAQGPTSWCFLVSASTSTGTYRDAPVLSIGELWSPEYFNTRPPGVLLKRRYHVLPERRLQGFRGQCQLLLGVSETHTPQAPLCVCDSLEDTLHQELRTLWQRTAFLSSLCIGFHDVFWTCTEAPCCCLALVKYTAFSFSLCVYMQHTHCSCFDQGFPRTRAGANLGLCCHSIQTVVGPLWELVPLHLRACASAPNYVLALATDSFVVGQSREEHLP